MWTILKTWSHPQLLPSSVLPLHRERQEGEWGLAEEAAMRGVVRLESGMGEARHLEGPPSERYSVEVKAGVTYAEVVKASVPYVEEVKVDVRYVAPAPRNRAVRYPGYVLEHEACLALPESQQQGADVPTLIHMARDGVTLGRRRAGYQFVDHARYEDVPYMDHHPCTST